MLNQSSAAGDMSLGSAGKLALISVGFVFFLFAGCRTQKETTAPPVTMPDSLSDAGTQQVSERWWTAFGDRQLNAMVDTALESNFNLRIAWQRLRAARAVVDRETGALFPDLEAYARGDASRNLDEFQESENMELGLSTVYELDLWGRIRSNIRAEQFRVEATLADYQAASISLSAEITRTWYQLTEARSQLELVQQQIETNETVLNLLENRFGTGQIRSVDILRQRQLLESTQEQKIETELRIEVLEHRLSVLLGRPPQKDIEYARGDLPTLPPLPETGLPIDLVRRRPDVQSAFNRLRAADQDMAAAISNQYPRLTLSASVSTAANNAENLFEQWMLSFTGNLLAPLFYGGALSAEVDRTEAVKHQRLYEYGQTVLTAFQEVENAIVEEKKQRERIRSLEEQVSLAQQSYEQLRLEYFNGISDYLDVLTALDEVQQLQRELLTAKLTLVEDRIALYRALAGSFETKKQARDVSQNGL